MVQFTMEGEGDTNVGSDIIETGLVAGAGNEVKEVNGDEERKDNELESERTLKDSEEKGSGEPAAEVEVGMTMEEAKTAFKQLQKLTKPSQEQYQVCDTKIHLL